MGTGTRNVEETDEATDNMEHRPVDKTVPTFGCFVLVAAGALNFGCGLSIPISLSVMFLDWQESFSATRAATAAVHSTCVGILFGGGVVAGYVINKFGPRVTFIIGTCLASLGMFLGAFATNITFMLVSVGILAGCGCCLIQLPCIPCVTRPFRTRQGTIIAIVTTGGALINLVLPYLYNFLMDTYSWRGAFIIISGMCFNTLVLDLIVTSYMPSPQLTSPTDSSPEAVILVSAKGNDLELVELDDGDKLRQDRGSNDVLKQEGNGLEGSQNAETGVLLSNNSSETTGNGKDISTKTSDLAEAGDGLLSGKLGGDLEGAAVDDVDVVLPRLSLTRLRHSAWRFLLDPLAWAIIAYLGLTLASEFCAMMLAMDIANNKGYPDKGLLLIYIGFIAGLVGKALSGIFGLFRSISSFLILAGAGLLGSVSLFLLGAASGLPATVGSMIGVSISMGLIVAMFPKCFLDLPSMDEKSYPLALGLGNTVEGIFNFLIPILTGHMVDVSGTYVLPFSILSGFALVTSCSLALVFWWSKRKSKGS